MKYLMFILLLLSQKAISQSWGVIDCDPFPSKCVVINNMSFYEFAYAQQDSTYVCDFPIIMQYFSSEASYTLDVRDVGYPMYYIIFNYDVPNNIEGFSTEGHEVLHLMQDLYDFYAVDFTQEVESSSYLFEHLVTEVDSIVHKK